MLKIMTHARSTESVDLDSNMETSKESNPTKLTLGLLSPNRLSDSPLPNGLIPNIVKVINKDPYLDSTTTYRRQREKFWIYRPRSESPLGLNIKG